MQHVYFCLAFLSVFSAASTIIVYDNTTKSATYGGYTGYITHNSQCNQNKSFETCYNLLWVNGTSGSVNLNTKTFSKMGLNISNSAFFNVISNNVQCNDGEACYNVLTINDTPASRLYINIPYVLRFIELPWTQGKFNLTIGSFEFDPDVTTCATSINSAGYYTLINDLDCSGTAITIASNNVILDCDFHLINYSWTNANNGIYATNRQNVTVKNCIVYQLNASITNTGYGAIKFTNVQNSSIINSYGYSANRSWGIMVNPALNVTLENVTGVSENATGLRIDSGTMNSVFNNVYGQSFTQEGLMIFTASHNNYIENATGITYRGNAGVYIAGNNYNNTLVNVNASSYFTPALVVNSSNFTSLRNINATSFRGFGCSFVYRANSTFAQNLSCYSNLTTALYIGSGSGNNTIQYLDANSNGSSAVYLDNDSYSSSILFANITTLLGVNAVQLGVRTNGNYIANASINGPTYMIGATINVTNNLCENCTFLGNTRTLNYVQNSTLQTLLNPILFNKSALFILQSSTAIANYTVQWFTIVNVTDHSGNPISGATVNFTDNMSFVQDMGTTGANGLTAAFITNETTVANLSGTLTYTNYNDFNFTVTKTGYDENSTNFTITSSGIINIRLKASGAVDNPPVTWLNFSATGNLTTDSTPLFICSAEDDIKLVNITLVVWNSTNGMIQNVSTRTNKVNSSNFIQSLADGLYNWTCFSMDNASQLSWNSTNRTIEIDSTGPVIDQRIPTNASVISAINKTTLWCNFSDIHNVSYTWVTFNGATNQTAGNSSFIATGELSNGVYSWNCSANDTLGNVRNEANWTFTMSYGIPDNIPPTLVTRTPANASSFESLSYTLSCTFSDNVAVSHSWIDIWNGNSNEVHDLDLGATTSYVLTLASAGSRNWSCGANDTSGNIINETNWTITLTGDITPPMLVSRTPANASLLFGNTTTLGCVFSDNTAVTLSELWIWNGTTNISYASNASGYIYSTITVASDTQLNWSCTARDSVPNFAYEINWTLNFTSEGAPPFRLLYYPLWGTSQQLRSTLFSCIATSESIPIVNTEIIIKYAANNSIYLAFNTTNTTPNTLYSSIGVYKNIADGDYQWGCNVTNQLGLVSQNKTENYFIVRNNPAYDGLSGSRSSDGSILIMFALMILALFGLIFMDFQKKQEVTQRLED